MGKFKILEGLELQNISSTTQTNLLGYNTTTGEVTYQANSVPNPLNVGGPITGSDLRLTSVDQHSTGYYFPGDLKVLTMDGTDVKYVQYNKLIGASNSQSDHRIFIDSNYGSATLYERVINDGSSAGLPDLVDINGRTLSIDQSNSTTGTLRFGLANWTAAGSNEYTYGTHFECEIINTGQYKFRLGFYVPSVSPAYWDFFWVGHDSGGGSSYRVAQTNATQGNTTVYSTSSAKYIGPASRTKIYYDSFAARVTVFCTNWTN